ncbi:MAG: hypothetical protein M1429_01370 [Patescibacteria group bacterium]|nr:hypothetical protein [Patescibacteria group bacterium]
MKKISVFFFQLILIFWILGCLYVWLTLEFVTNPGLIMIRPNIPPRISNILGKSRQMIWPYVWKDYVYTQK